MSTPSIATARGPEKIAAEPSVEDRALTLAKRYFTDPAHQRAALGLFLAHLRFVETGDREQLGAELRKFEGGR